METPDRVIVRKIKAYDPHLFIEWNNRKHYFEIWRHMPHGRRLVTPVTQSIYDSDAPVEYTPLDERILWWLYEADSWRRSSPSTWGQELDNRWLEFQEKADRASRRQWYEIAKDIYGATHNFFFTKHASKNGKPSFDTKKPERKWVRPDIQCRTSSRLFQRSALNARRAYG